MTQLWIATQIHQSQNRVYIVLNFMSHTERWHNLSDRCEMSEWVISSCLDEWQRDTLWCVVHFSKMLWQLHLSIVGFSSRLCGIIDLSSASSSTIPPLLLLSGQQFIKHLHLFSLSLFFASTDKECQMWRFQYRSARLDGDKRLTSLGTVFGFLHEYRLIFLSLLTKISILISHFVHQWVREKK